MSRNFFPSIRVSALFIALLSALITSGCYRENHQIDDDSDSNIDTNTEIGSDSSTSSDPDDSATDPQRLKFISADEDAARQLSPDDGSSDADTDGDVDMDADMDADTDADTDADSDMDTGSSWDTDSGSDDGTPPNGEDAVIEGDIYRVLSENIILNLNSYRGLQIIDFADASAPSIIGRFPARGTPVEMYADGDTVYVLFNNWQSYYGNRSDIAVQNYVGGMVAAIDISDMEKPALINQLPIPGTILTSRMVTGTTRRALYVVAQDNDGTVVNSFSANADGQLTAKTSLNLGGYVTDIQATSTALLVANYDWNISDTSSTVDWIDISNPSGVMVAGPTFTATGIVLKKSDMSINGNILRVVSGNQWGWGGLNHLQTWNISDINTPVAVDSADFGQDENLYATLFLGNKGFFVTFRQTDPFHTFEIADDGQITEKSEYVISGWNDFFKPAFNNSRIVGTGTNNGTLAISLYDTNLDNPAPFIDRVELTEGWANSEAQWDDRAFTVLDNAVSVLNSDGAEETGLVLLPFTAWNDATWKEESGVKILTFSPTSVTLRGTMGHSSPVRRSFLADDATIANMSEENLNLFDFVDPDAPSLLGSVELAPYYSDFLVYGDHGVRVKTQPSLVPDYDYSDVDVDSDIDTDADMDADSDSDTDVDTDWIDTGWDSETAPSDTETSFADTATEPDTAPPPASGGAEALAQTGLLEIVSLTASPDTAPVLASIKVPLTARVFKKDDLAVAVSPDPNTDGLWIIDVIDLTNPLSPKKAGTVSTQLPGYRHNNGGGLCYDDCFGGGCRQTRNTANAQIVGNAIVIPSLNSQSRVLETSLFCETSAREDYSYEDDGTTYTSIYYDGSIRCITTADGVETCEGEILKCVETYNYETGEWDYGCDATNVEDIQTQYTCYEEDIRRRWESLEFAVVDLSDPTAPVALPTMAMPEEQESAGFVVKGSHLYVNHKVPVTVEGDTRPWVSYFVTDIELENPASPVIAAPVNIPGAVFGVSNNTLITRDPVWTDERIDTTLNTVIIRNGTAERLATRKFENKEVQSMIVDGSGHAFISVGRNQPYWYWYEYNPDYDLDYDYMFTNGTNSLKVLDITAEDMPVLGSLDIDSWATLQRVENDRALFSVPGGMLIVNLDEVSAPVAQAYYPLQGWEFDYEVLGDTAILSTGRYGIQEFDLNVFNLLD